MNETFILNKLTKHFGLRTATSAGGFRNDSDIDLNHIAGRVCYHACLHMDASVAYGEAMTKPQLRRYVKQQLKRERVGLGIIPAILLAWRIWRWVGFIWDAFRDEDTK